MNKCNGWNGKKVNSDYRIVNSEKLKTINYTLFTKINLLLIKDVISLSAGNKGRGTKDE